MNTALAGARKAHVAIHVKNVEASVEFYRKLFGIEPSRVRHGYAKFDVANPPLNFTLNEGGAGKRWRFCRTSESKLNRRPMSWRCASNGADGDCSLATR